MAKKTKEEVQAWVAEKKAQGRKGDRLVIANEPTTSATIGQMKKEVEVL